MSSHHLTAPCAAPTVSRRSFLHGVALVAGGIALGGCVPGAPSPGASHAGAPSMDAVSPSGTAAPIATFDGETLRRKVARLLVVGFRGVGIDEEPWVRRAIEDGLGGVILFDRDGKTGGRRNVASPDQVRHLTADLQAAAGGRTLIVAIDQEGGLVTRLSPRYGFPELVSARAIGSKPAAQVKAWADGLAATVADAGINLNLAPVVDLDVNPENPAIGALRRAFSADPGVVARDAELAVLAHRERSVRTSLKHFPGLGSASVNTDYGVADVSATWTDAELGPYRHLLGLGMVDTIMAGHLVNGQLDASVPASLSHATVTGLLREQLGWGGLVVTDDLQAAAITDAFGFDDAVALAIEAGNDLLLFANQQAYQPGLVSRVGDLVEGLIADGRLTEARIDASVARIEARFPAPG